MVGRSFVNVLHTIFIASLVYFTWGCASTDTLETTSPPGDRSVEQKPTGASTTNQITGATAHKPTSTNETAQAKPPTPKPRPKPVQPKTKPWTLTLERGHFDAKLDNVLFYLSQPAVQDSKGIVTAVSAKTRVNSVDYAHFISPLISASAKPISPSRPLRIFIDPGHGGIDPGAISKDGRTREATIALAVSKRLEQHLRQAGFAVRLSRPSNALTQVLEMRTLQASRWKADVFVSIHCNSSTSTSPRGIETYVMPAHKMLSTFADPESTISQAQANVNEPGNAHNVRNVQLGFAIQRRLVQSTKLPDRGLRTARFVVLRTARMPAVLVECGYLSSSLDLNFMRTAAGQEKLARGIFEGICDYALGTLKPGYPARSIQAEPIWKSNVPTRPIKQVTLPPPTDPSHYSEEDYMKKVREAAAAAAGL